MNTLMPVVIVSGPSGSGKSTLIQRVLSGSNWPLRLSVSATTRLPRPGEQDGVHYHFWTREKFRAEVDAGAFLEWAEVHGNYYGTLRREVDPFRTNGVMVILDIDVQGARQARKQYPDAVTVFVRTSSMDAYEERLRKRGTESEAAIQRRLETARTELAHADAYTYQVTNDDLEQAESQLRNIIQRFVMRAEHVG